MCSQKDANTIEGNLFAALVKAGAVSEDNSDDPVSGIIFWLNGVLNKSRPRSISNDPHEPMQEYMLLATSSPLNSLLTCRG
jgi:hypothetical protein